MMDGRGRWRERNDRGLDRGKRLDLDDVAGHPEPMSCDPIRVARSSG
jgi:hypothetical protein